MIIAVLGPDGAGKATLINNIKPYLWEKWRTRGGVYRISLPNYDSDSGKLIRKFQSGLLGELDPYSIASLYAVNRLEEKNRIISNASNNVLILDRYIQCNIAYQRYRCEDVQAANKLQAWIENLEYGTNNLPRADVCIYLDTVPEISMRRTQGKVYDKNERDYALQYGVRDEYLQMAEYGHEHWIIVPTYEIENGHYLELSKDSIANNVIEQLEKLSWEK